MRRTHHRPLEFVVCGVLRWCRCKISHRVSRCVLVVIFSCKSFASFLCWYFALRLVLDWLLVDWLKSFDRRVGPSFAKFAWKVGVNNMIIFAKWPPLWLVCITSKHLRCEVVGAKSLLWSRWCEVNSARSLVWSRWCKAVGGKSLVWSRWCEVVGVKSLVWRR